MNQPRNIFKQPIIEKEKDITDVMHKSGNMQGGSDVEEAEDQVSLQEQSAIQDSDDQEKINAIREKMNSVDWAEFWKNEGLASPAREEVFPNGEDKNMSDAGVVEALNKYLEKQGSDLFNMTGIDSKEFPEIIDADIRDVCVRLNSLPFLRTKEGCGGHEFDRTGELSNRGYSEPYLTFYAEEENENFRKFKEHIDNNLEKFQSSDLPGIENVVIDVKDGYWEIKTEGIGIYSYSMDIAPTREWCERNNKKYIERPEPPSIYPDWCQDNGFEYSEYEDGKSRREYEKIKKEYWQKVKEFGDEYGEYFRSEEARKLRDEFFKIFMSEIFRPEQSKTEKIKTAETTIHKTVSELRNVGLFSAAYLDKIKLVLFPDKEETSSILIYENGKIEEKKEQGYSAGNFMNGLETDYVGLSALDDYEDFNMNDLNDKQFVVTLFYEERPPYDEFVAHEIGHNIFDLAYNQTEGGFEMFDLLDENGNKNGETTDCSENYKKKIREKIQKLFDKYDVELSIAEFGLQRQKIAEIFALLTQREFSKRMGDFEKNHGNVDMGKAKEISSDLAEKINGLNARMGRNISVDDFYSENHTLSCIVAPILEYEYPDFNEMMKFFELKTEIFE